MLRFKATRPGTFVYHCAPGGPMIPWHVVSGMAGAIMRLGSFAVVLQVRRFINFCNLVSMPTSITTSSRR